MAIHLEVEYAKRFEGVPDASEAGDSAGGDGEEKETPSPLPPKADVSWAHILAQHQVCPWGAGGSRVGTQQYVACLLSCGGLRFSSPVQQYPRGLMPASFNLIHCHTKRSLDP